MGISSNYEPYWKVVERIIKESDVVLEILDARLIELSRNEELEKLIEKINRPLIFVINKSDLISKDLLKKSIDKLRVKNKVVFVSNQNRRSIRILMHNIDKAFKEHGKAKDVYSPDEQRIYRQAKADILVGVLGYPNVGKSSIINALSKKGKAKVSKKAGTTHGIQWIKGTEEIKFIDSPGVIPLKQDEEIRYSLIGSRNPEKIRDPEAVVNSIIELFVKNNKSAFENFYSVEISNKSYETITSEISRKKGHLLKGGNLDKNRTFNLIIRDWQQGRLRM